MKKDKNAWGFDRKDLEKYGVQLLVDVSFSWSDKTPAKLRKTLGQASHVLAYIADRQIHFQLAMDGLTPTTKRHFIYGWGDGRRNKPIKRKSPVPIRKPSR